MASSRMRLAISFASPFISACLTTSAASAAAAASAFATAAASAAALAAAISSAEGPRRLAKKVLMPLSLTKKFLMSPSSPFSFTITANAGACDAPAGGAPFALAMQMQNSSKSRTPSLLESISLIMDSSSASVGLCPRARITTPTSLLVMVPLESLSKTANACLYWAIKFSKSGCSGSRGSTTFVGSRDAST